MKIDGKKSIEISSNDEDENYEEVRNDEKYSKQSENLTTQTIFSELTNKNTFSHKICWEKQFAHKISINIIDTNFQSSIFSLHYGNFRLLCHTLFIKFPQNIFSTSKALGIGSFGCVYQIDIDGKCYAVKVINIKGGLSKGITDQFYQQYFLNCLADQLGVGPKMFPIFGYDFLISQNSVIFSMQKCSQSKIKKRQPMEDQLVHALSTMHSFGFIHLDIKPENIAFSENLEKHVFLDFGLSKLISEKIGEKSLTHFIGTLHFCSEEMKKCYLLREKLLVDLYKNDQFSLAKSLDDPTMRSQNFVFEIEQKTFWQQNNAQKNNQIFIQKLCAIINLKYQIFQNDLNKIFELLQKCIEQPKCCCEIFENKHIRAQVLQDNRINTLRKLMKEKMFQSRQTLSKIDLQISAFLSEEACKSVIEFFFPIGGIIKMQKQKFIETFTSPQWLTKIFLFLDPFQSETIRQVSDEKWAQRKKLIEKIFYFFASKQQKKQSNRIPSFISLKTEYVLRFLYEKIKQLKNLKVLVSLRMLLIASMSNFDVELIQTIEQQILFLTENRDELILRMIDFTLFWRHHHCSFDFHYDWLDYWVQKVLSPSKRSQNQKSDSMSKLKFFFSLFNAIQDLSALAEYVKKIGIQEFSKQFSQSQNQKNKDLFNNVFTLLMYYVRIIMKADLQMNFPSNSLFYIYFFQKQQNVKSHPYCSKGFIHFQDIFITLNYEISKMLLYYRKQGLFQIFDNLIFFYEVIGLNDKIISYFSRTIIKYSWSLLRYFQMMLQYCYQASRSYKETFGQLGYISMFFTMIEAHLRNSQTQTRITSLQHEQINEKIKPLLSFMKQKYVHSTKIKVFECKMKSIEIQLALNDNEKKVSLTKQFTEIILNYKKTDPLFIKSLFSIFIENRRQIQQVEASSLGGYHFQNAYQKFCDDLIKRNGINLFGYHQGIFTILIQLKLSTNKIEQCFRYLLLATQIFPKLEENGGMKAFHLLQEAYIKLLDSSDNNFLCQKYFWLINNKENEIKYISLIFIINYKIKYLLSKQQRISNIYRFIKYANNMKCVHFLTQRFSIFDQVLELELFKNEKKKRILLKKRDLYLLISFPNIFTSIWTTINKGKIQKITKLKIKNLLKQKNNEYQIVGFMTNQPIIF